MSNRTLTVSPGRAFAIALAVTVFSTMAPARAQEGRRGQDSLKRLEWDTLLAGHGAPFQGKTLVTGFQNHLTDLVRTVSELKRQGVSPEDAATRVDMTAHQKDFPQIARLGAELRGVRRLYVWLDERRK